MHSPPILSNYAGRGAGVSETSRFLCFEGGGLKLFMLEVKDARLG
jgi:hypothetical protein